MLGMAGAWSGVRRGRSAARYAACSQPVLSRREPDKREEESHAMMTSNEAPAIRTMVPMVRKKGTLQPAEHSVLVASQVG